MNNNDRVGNLLIRNDPLEPDQDFARYVLVRSANLGSNDSDPPLLAIRFAELPFAIRLDSDLATQLRDGLNVLLTDCDHSIGGEAPPDHDWGDDEPEAGSNGEQS